jgi:putative heme-binding domain-containing protein
MTVPEGFTVEVVAAEPDVVNPVAMFIDEKGRFWITESFEYPRKEPGPGKDRIRVLEDTNGDGKVDKATTFAEGLNIPSGIAVGYGGVWVCNSPDLLFMQDTDGDGRADKSEVVVTGFGRTDTHELPNSLTWGPDGWLYGLNGVFNYSKVSYGPQNPNYQKHKDQVWDFTCAMFRIHPRTREFQIFAEGTSNPWGIAINDEGDFFVSACVIDHLWHIVETGYYIRQGGPYPPQIWPIGSIVQHKHQKAAYCGITWFDSDAYPPEYRGVLYMGNIHGGCINADLAERSGSTYKGKPHPGFPAKPQAWKDDQYNQIAKTGDPNNPKLADFLTANDAWFMPVVQKTGPDGCLYILDWYDRYHCYQDANADPAGIERSKGRLYRVRYKDTPRVQPFDLAKKSDDELIDLLGSPNVYYRDAAQRLLGERGGETTNTKLLKFVSDASRPTKQRLHALYAAAAIGLNADQLWSLGRQLTQDPFNGWVLRLEGDNGDARGATEIDRNGADSSFVSSELVTSPASLQQEVIGIAKFRDDKLAMRLLLGCLRSPHCDLHLTQIIWRNLSRRILARPDDFAELLTLHQDQLGTWQAILGRSILELSETKEVSGQTVGKALAAVLQAQDVSNAVREECLLAVKRTAQAGTLDAQRLRAVLAAAGPATGQLPDRSAAIVLALQALNGDQHAHEQLRRALSDSQKGDGAKVEALQALVAGRDPQVLQNVGGLLAARSSKELRIGVVEAISRLSDPQVADVLLSHFASFEPDVQPKAIEVLTQRPAWSLALMKDIAAGKIDKTLVNLNQLNRMNQFKDDELKQLVTKTYGTIRANARSDRQGIINKNKDFLRGTPGDPFLGQAVFKRVCAQCHKLYGEGAEVGPDITRNGRNNWDQLLQNVFDPSAVIGPGYQARMLATADGRVLTGLPVEESDERVVLKLQGGKLETVPRSDIEVYKVSELSLMPDELEKLMTPQELADLMAYLSLDKPPADAEAKILPGAPEQKRR